MEAEIWVEAKDTEETHMEAEVGKIPTLLHLHLLM